MLVWFFDAVFNIFLILHPTVHFVTDKFSIQLHLSCCLDKRFQKQCLTHFTHFTRSFQSHAADVIWTRRRRWHHLWVVDVFDCLRLVTAVTFDHYVFTTLPLGCKSMSSVYLYLKSCIRVWFLGCRRCILWDCSWPRKPHMTSAHVMVWGHLLQFPDLIEAGDMYASILNTYLVFWYFISTHI